MASTGGSAQLHPSPPPSPSPPPFPPTSSQLSQPPSPPSLSSQLPSQLPSQQLHIGPVSPSHVQLPIQTTERIDIPGPAIVIEDTYAECSDADATADTGVPQRGWLCFCRETEDERFERVLARTTLTRMQKNSIRRRFFEILREFRFRCRFYSLLFHIGHFTITVGSLVVPALLSVQYAGSGITFIDANSFQAQVYWTTWILSLLVTMFNGVLVLFKVDMKYYFLHTTLERLRSEGWQYLQLTGRYSGTITTPPDVPTHRNQYKFFCHYVEKIKLKQVEEEYYKYEDAQKNAATGTSTGTGHVAATAPLAPVTAQATPSNNTGVIGVATNTNLYPPSLNKNIETLAEQAPPSVQDAIRGLVRTQSRAILPPETIASINRAANVTINPTSPPLPMQSPLRQPTT